MGSDFDLSPDSEWQTPLGKSHVDQQLCEALMKRFPQAHIDGRAHVREHSLEVQLPFLQVLKHEFSFVPLCVRQHRYQYLEELGHALAEVVRQSGKTVMIIASSDMNHYEDQATTERKDRLAIDQIEKLDPRGLYDSINMNNITMCGYLPATAAIVASKDLGAKKAELMKHATSGDITGDYREVVGYAGIRIQ
jgi:AmmeMemoRadiSam system protein B